ncbi:hypothetical protein [Streptomyces pratensis]
MIDSRGKDVYNEMSAYQVILPRRGRRRADRGVIDQVAVTHTVATTKSR